MVRVRAEPLEGAAPPVETDARRDADPLGVRYRASLALAPRGPWRVTVSIAGPAGPGALSFPVDVEPAGLGWWPPPPSAPPARVAAAVAVALAPRRLAGVALGRSS